MTETTTQTLTTPKEIDTELAARYGEIYRLQDKLAMYAQSALNAAGAEYCYRGRQRVTDMTLPEAEAILASDMAAHPDTGDDYGYTLIRGGNNIGNIRRAVAGLAETRQALHEAKQAAAELNERYTGWTRFFLVTSSRGHIHSSMRCHTCRPTTRYGWLPELSGQTEAEAVEAHGPALCTACFPSAPVEWQGGWITKAQAVKKAA